MFKLELSNNAVKFLKKCDSKIEFRLKSLFKILCQNPTPARDFDFRKVHGEKNTYRIRLSGYRVVYDVY
ncbi:MAG: type II toxin-antitoxin system RelE/ParE family toxin [archaeon]